MRAFLDCEFLWRGDLLSMGIVTDDGREWYEVIEPPPDISLFPWVVTNILSVADKEPVHPEVFRLSLHAFLSSLSSIEIIADWPADLAHFFSMLAGREEGSALVIPVIARIVPKQNLVSSIPHNALSDARALRDSLHRSAA